MRSLPPSLVGDFPAFAPNHPSPACLVFPAGPGLENVVEAFWDVSEKGTAGESVRVDILPVPAATISLQYLEAPTSHFNGAAVRIRSHLTGVHARNLSISTNGETGAVVVKFKP